MKVRFAFFEMGFIERYVALLAQRRVSVAVIVIWLALSVVGGVLTPAFLKATVNDMGVPANAPSLTAKAAARASNLTSVLRSGEYSLAMFVEAPTPIATGVEGKDMIEAIQAVASHEYPNAILWDGYFERLALGQKMSASGFVSSMGNSTIVSLDVSEHCNIEQVALFLDYQCKTLSSSPLYKGARCTVLGDAMNKEVIIDSVQYDLALGDGIAMPISLVVLGVTLRSARLLLIPLLSLVASALCTYGVMFVVAHIIPVISAAMSLITSILIAFTFDYCLFQLSRFVEECRAQEDDGTLERRQRIIASVLSTSGHTCMVSAGTLCLAFLSLVLIPQQVLRGLGVGSCAALFVVMAVQLTFVPSVLLLFFGFFEGAAGRGSCPDRVPAAIQRWWLRSEDFELDEDTRMRKSCWFRLGTRLTTLPWNIVVIGVVVCAVIPFAVLSFGFPVSDSLILALPRGSSFTNALIRLQHAFGAGFLQNFWLVATFDDPKTDLLSPQAVTSARMLLTSLYKQVPNTTCYNTASYVQASCNDLDTLLVKGCQLAPSFFTCPDIVSLFTSTTSTVAPSFLVMLRNYSFDLDSREGGIWYEALVNFAESRPVPGMSVQVGGGESWDGVVVAMKYFPLMVGLSFTAVFLLVALAFRSILIPLRSMLTIGMTLAFVYGGATAVYAYGVLDWIGFSGLEKAGSILWMPPLVSFSMVTGLCLDYDLFLLVRVREYYHAGMNTRDAIIKGLWKTGGIVTSAGVIMSIAFCSLLFSTSPAMNLLSFYTVMAVLFDTFIVRVCVVPALFSIKPHWNWWPGRSCATLEHTSKVPKVRSYEEEEEEDDDHEDNNASSDQLLEL